MANSREPIFQSQTRPHIYEAAITSRRKALRTIGLTASVLCATSASASAGWFWKKTDDEPSELVGGFPEEWTRLQGGNIQKYADYINSLKLKSITAQNVIAAHAKKRGNTWNSLPPKKLWSRMGSTLRAVDRISEVLDVPVKSIVSAYRSPQYNIRCDGASRSWHMANVAVDVKFDTSAYRATKAARSVRDGGFFKGGVGSYSSFTHIDTRGANINW